MSREGAEDIDIPERGKSRALPVVATDRTRPARVSTPPNMDAVTHPDLRSSPSSATLLFLAPSRSGPAANRVAACAPTRLPGLLHADSLLHPAMFARLPLLLLFSQLVLLARALPELHIKHKILHPSLPAAPFVDRATVLLTGSGPTAAARLVPSETLTDDLREYLEMAEGLKDALYQVALEHPGGAEQAQLASSSVLAVSRPPSRPCLFLAAGLQTPSPPSFSPYVYNCPMVNRGVLAVINLRY